MKKSYEIIEDVKKKLDGKKAEVLSEGLNHHWETPNQKKAFIDAFSSVEVKDYPIVNYVQSYADFVRSKIAEAEAKAAIQEDISEQEVDQAIEEELKKK